MSDWDASDNEAPVAAATKSVPSKPSAPPVKPVGKSKWEGEDEEDDNVASDWEESSEDEKPKATSAPVAPPKKKGTLKQKLAEKEREKAERLDNGEGDSAYDSDEVLDPREKARRDKEKELTADLSNAADLLGAAALGGTSDKELDKLISADLRTKEDFSAFSARVIEYLIKKHQNKPLYAAFVEEHCRSLALPLKDIEVRKVASGLTALSNEKQKEQREKTSGKKKSKTAAKPVLGSSKAGTKPDTALYTEALDDFGDDGDFM